MPKPTKGPRMGGSAAHERMMMANLACQLFTHGAITTTEARAKRVQPLAEKLITKAKRGDLHARRLVLKTLHNKEVMHLLFNQVIESIDTSREGGYTRIVKLPPRTGDNAPMAEISLVTEKVVAKKKAAPKAAPKAAAKAEEAKAEEAKAEEAKAEEAKAEEAAAEAAEAKAEEAAEAPAEAAAEEKAE